MKKALAAFLLVFPSLVLAHSQRAGVPAAAASSGAAFTGGTVTGATTFTSSATFSQVFGSVDRSSATSFDSVSTTQRSFIVAFASVTLTSDGGPVCVWSSATFTCQQIGFMQTNFYVDGQFSRGGTISGVCGTTQEFAGNSYMNISCPPVRVAVNPAAGSHTYAWAGYCDGGTFLQAGTGTFTAAECK